MAKSILFLLLSAVLVMVGPTAATRHTRTDAYVESTCQTTRFPSLCVRTLTMYARKYSVSSPEQLAQIALHVSLYRAEHTRRFMIRLSRRLRSAKAAAEYPAVEDCLVQINNSASQLGLAVKELRRLEQEGDDVSSDLPWHVSNVETWISTALTDASTCVAQFEGTGRRISKLRATVRGKAKNVAEVTSNALALFHQYTAAMYRARAAAKKP